MTVRTALAAFAFLIASALPGLASAAPLVVATADVNMRAGPGTGYPVVVTLPAGARAEAFGCVDGRAWCDVAWAGYRGWVASSYLSLIYRGAPVAFVRVPVAVAPPVVIYDPHIYYRAHYVGRPWYPYRGGVVVRHGGPVHGCVHGPRGFACR